MLRAERPDRDHHDADRLELSQQRRRETTASSRGLPWR
jgi:hypothetical protein